MQDVVTSYRDHILARYQVVFLHVVSKNEEDDVRKGFILAIATLAFLAGCGNQGDKASNVPAKPKWRGAAYHLAFDTQARQTEPGGRHHSGHQVHGES